MEQTVTFAAGVLPTWPTVRDLLAHLGYTVQVRMIDGQLAFPDEEPTAEWQELRLGTPQGMVTLRRGPGRIDFVTWGNADGDLRQAWNALVWAFAEAGRGSVQTPAGAVDAAAFRRTAELPPVLQP
jgi:hypothetical protein